MKKFLLLGTLVGTLVVGLYITYILTRPEKVIGFGEKIHRDDFDYSVLNVEKLPTIGGRTQPATANGTFYVVTLKVENHAIRVNHQWDISMAYIEDQVGQAYRHSVEGQEAWDKACGIRNAALHNTSPGVFETAEIVFELPQGVKNPCLKIWKDVLMGDAFDGIAYRKVKVPLD